MDGVHQIPDTASNANHLRQDLVLAARLLGLDGGEVVFEEITKRSFLEELMHGALESNDILKMNMAIMIIGVRTLINIRFGFACNLLDVLIA